MSDSDLIQVRVVGIGGAGANVLDRLVLENAVDADLVACNTDVQSLASSVAAQKVQLGRNITRGLGAGGDPDLGFSAAEESAHEIGQALAGAPLLFIVAGLGGGTGSGATPLVVKMARDRGALVLALVTLPFSFEGRRRQQQALESLDAIRHFADAVICFENDRMSDVALPSSGVHEAFAKADQLMGQCIRSVIDLVQRRGLIRLGFDDLLTALRTHESRCLFGHGEAEGHDRAAAALDQALRSPLMDQGVPLSDVANVLVNIAGGTDLTLAEVQTMMRALTQRTGDHTQVLFGAAVDSKLNGRLAVTIISSLTARTAEPAAMAPAPMAAPPPPMRQLTSLPHTSQVPSAAAAAFSGAPLRSYVPPAPVPAPAPPPPPAPVAPKPRSITDRVLASGGGAPAAVATAPAPRRAPEPEPAPAPAPAPEPAHRGRFEKGEPTIVNGEDLDVPAFFRKRIK